MWRALAAFAVGALVGACSETGLGLNLVPESQVQEMGQDAWRQIKAETPASSNREYQQRAESVAARLLRAAGENPSEWEVVVFKNAEPNAFALPGKKIGVFEGMMRTASTDEQLATVISHEVGHVEANHGGERINSEMATNLGVNIASSILGGSTGIPPQAMAGLLGAGAQYGMLLPYSRNQELEADSLGLGYMAHAGYDPRQSVELWRKMSQLGDRPPAFLSTHPAPEDRIEQLQAMMPEAMRTYQATQQSTRR